ncbi:aminoacyl-tRNA hydrolase [Bowdeniella nasicola]|uniref:Peptidyl-tRNA hydrolase n=1 Tax=Bowdeniella nasicola TaxID=208480 RepID=A0A1Q5Q170_9ACTO|nr:aminoacyl-tRNA hydrolase [Bowdeniella nasicola]OKL53571.1 aminoacyl-tRNA hydrolase [Bowdeniella nasicola]
MSEPWLVIGLGNPGPKYAYNRHNVGYLVVGELLARARASLTKHKSGASVADVRLGLGPGGAPGPRAILAITNTYMNVSGAPVRSLTDFYSVGPERLLVVHDELDLPAHTLRLKRGGGEGGHNGLKSITQHVGTREYGRLRVGIDRPPGRMDPAAYVLQDFPAGQREDWGVSVAQAADVVEDVAGAGFEAAQMRLHSA